MKREKNTNTKKLLNRKNAIAATLTASLLGIGAIGTIYTVSSTATPVATTLRYIATSNVVPAPATGSNIATDSEIGGRSSSGTKGHAWVDTAARQNTENSQNMSPENPAQYQQAPVGAEGDSAKKGDPASAKSAGAKAAVDAASKGKGKGGRGVKTGDESNIFLYLGGLAASMSALAGAFVFRKKRENA